MRSLRTLGSRALLASSRAAPSHPHLHGASRLLSSVPPPPNPLPSPPLDQEESSSAAPPPAALASSSPDPSPHPSLLAPLPPPPSLSAPLPALLTPLSAAGKRLEAIRVNGLAPEDRKKEEEYLDDLARVLQARRGISTGDASSWKGRFKQLSAVRSAESR